MKVCHSCLKKSDTTYCPKCKKELFNGINVDKVHFNPSDMNEDERVSYQNGLSLSGVQVKYSVGFNDKKELDIAETDGAYGTYILKPVPPNTTHSFISDICANEHLSMQIGKQVFKLNTADNAIIYLEDDSISYITKRFDVHYHEGKRFRLPQEDFAILSQRTEEANGARYKYEYSYEEVANLIEKYVSASLPAKVEFYKRVMYNFLVSNGDAHLKNFSIHKKYGMNDYLLTPNYDVLNSRMHIGNKEHGNLGLDLFKDDVTTRSFGLLGYESYEDFHQFAELIKIPKATIEKTEKDMQNSMDKVNALVERSFLSDSAKSEYEKQFKDRVRLLNYKIQ